MKRIALTALLAVVQVLPSVPRKAANNFAQTATQIKSKSASSEAGPLPAPASVKTDSNGPTKADSGEQHSEETQHTVGISELPPVTVNPAKRDWADWAYWGFNLLLVAVGGFQVYMLFRTLQVVNRQAKETGRQVEVTAGQLRAMNEQITEMSVQSGILKESVDVSRDAAKAANANIDLLVNKERTRIFVEVSPLELKATTHMLGNYVKYTIIFHSPTFAFIEDTVASATVSESRESPSSDQLFGSINIPKVIPPNFPNEECYSFIHGARDQFEIDQISHGKSFIYFRGFIKYKDFMGRDRETHFCYRWHPQGANSLAPVGWLKAGPPEANRET